MKNRVNYGAMSTHIAFQVHLTWRAIRKWLLADARKGEDRVTRGSYSVPMLIGLNPGISPQEIADALYLDAPKVTIFLRDMEAAGQISRTSSPSDRRKVQIRLTESGEELMRHAVLMSARMESRWREILTEDETAELVRLLAKIRRREASDAE